MNPVMLKLFLRERSQTLQREAAQHRARRQLKRNQAKK
jgi:hypothetical protein